MSYLGTAAYSAAKASRADLMTDVRTAVDGDAKTRAQIEADAGLAEGDLDRILAGDYMTLEQAHQIFSGLTTFEGLTFAIDTTPGP